MESERSYKGISLEEACHAEYPQSIEIYFEKFIWHEFSLLHNKSIN